MSSGSAPANSLWLKTEKSPSPLLIASRISCRIEAILPTTIAYPPDKGPNLGASISLMAGALYPRLPSQRRAETECKKQKAGLGPALASPDYGLLTHFGSMGRTCLPSVTLS